MAEEFKGEHAELTDKVLACFYRVANDLGFGFLELYVADPFLSHSGRPDCRPKKKFKSQSSIADFE